MTRPPSRAIVGCALVVMLLTGCSGDTSNPSPNTNKIASDAVKLILTKALTGLDQPTAFGAIPNSDLLLVAERTGRVWALQATANGLEKVGEPIIDLSDLVITAGSEQGLLGIAVSAFGSQIITNSVEHEPGAENSGNGTTTIRSFSIDRTRFGAAALRAADSRVLLTVAQPYSNHNGGQVIFGPDGLLYIGLGDGGSGGDPQNRAQNTGEILGKIARIDPRAISVNIIPTDNPFVGAPGARGEIWTLGVRNPWRFDIDPATGDLWVADVGQDDREEITRLAGPGLPSVGGRGVNLGWPLVEGTLDGGTDNGRTGDRSKLVGPVAEFPHQDGYCAIIGGPVVRKSSLPAFDGGYLFTDSCRGEIGVVRNDTVSLHPEATVTSPTTFAMGPEGRIYVATQDGDVFFITESS